MKIKISTEEGFKDVNGVVVTKNIALIPIFTGGVAVEYRLTHIPTGYKIDWLRCRDVAIAYARSLEAVIDWNFTDDSQISEDSKHLGRMVHRRYTQLDLEVFQKQKNFDTEQALEEYFGLQSCLCYYSE